MGMSPNTWRRVWHPMIAGESGRSKMGNFMSFLKFFIENVS